MGYVRFKLSEETHGILRKMCKNLGMKESEISRIALIEYMKSLSLITEKVKKTTLIRHYSR